MMWWLLASVGWSQPVAVPPSASEELVVWGDPFARWDGTRWYVETTWMHPLGVELLADDNLGFEAAAMRMRATLACEIDGKLGTRQREVMCQIEDVALQAIAREKWTPEGSIEAVLEELDGKLTDAFVQLQVSADGAVFDVDLEGIRGRNQRQRRAKEQARQLVRRLVAPFHLRVQPGERWRERNGLMMQLPSPTGTLGSAEQVHEVVQAEGQWVLQTVGAGVATVEVEDMVPAPDPINPSMTTYQRKIIGEAGWNLSTTGVGIVDPDLGYVTERVYATTGEALASSAIVSGDVWHHGQLRWLSPTERPALGATGPGVPATR